MSAARGAAAGWAKHGIMVAEQAREQVMAKFMSGMRKFAADAHVMAHIMTRAPARHPQSAHTLVGCQTGDVETTRQHSEGSRWGVIGLHVAGACVANTPSLQTANRKPLSSLFQVFDGL
jgi:hypothetical protein